MLIGSSKSPRSWQELDEPLESSTKNINYRINVNIIFELLLKIYFKLRDLLFCKKQKKKHT